VSAEVFANLAEHDFVAAVQALEREGGPVRFRGRPSLAFAPAALTGGAPASGGRPAELEVAFLGLYGTEGALPAGWTELLLAAEAEGDTALRDFLDLLNDRLLTLFYEACLVAHPGLAWAREQRGGARDELLHFALEALGVGPPEGVPAEALAFHLGLLLAAPAQTALERLLASHFAVPVRVVPFAGGPGHFRLEVGPMALGRYRDFLPGGSALGPLLRLTRLAVGLGPSFDVYLRLEGEGAGCVLGPDEDEARLGWLGWLAGAEEEERNGTVSAGVCLGVERDTRDVEED
jgi:type VI secretion system protein ImpH